MKSKIKRSYGRKESENIKKWLKYFIGFTVVISLSLVIVINININFNINFDATYITNLLATFLVLIVLMLICFLFGPTIMEQTKSISHNQ